MAHEIIFNENRPFLDIVDLVEQDTALFPFFKHVFVKNIIQNPNNFLQLPPFIQEDLDIAKTAYQQLFIRSARKDTNLDLMDYALRCLYTAKYKKEIEGRIKSIKDPELNALIKEIELYPEKIEFLCAEDLSCENFAKTVHTILKRETDIAKSSVCYKNILPVGDFKKHIEDCEKEYELICPKNLRYIPPYKQKEIEEIQQKSLEEDYENSLNCYYDYEEYIIPSHILKEAQSLVDE